MTHAEDRARFLAQMAREGMPEDVARLVLRDAQTVQRMAEFELSYPVPERERASWDARAEAAERRIRERCRPFGIVPHVQGDARGACVKLLLPSGKWDSWGGAEDGYCVPARGMSPADYKRADRAQRARERAGV